MSAAQMWYNAGSRRIRLLPAPSGGINTPMSVQLHSLQALIIDGQRVPSASGQTYETINPATGQGLAQVAEAGLEDVERAVAAARHAFDDGPWPTMPASQRARVLFKMAEIIRERA